MPMPKDANLDVQVPLELLVAVLTVAVVAKRVGAPPAPAGAPRRGRGR